MSSFEIFGLKNLAKPTIYTSIYTRIYKRASIKTSITNEIGHV